MTQTQLDVFQVSAGVSATDLTLAIAGVMALIFLLWGAWIALSQLRQWQTQQGTLFDLKINIIRAAVIMLLLGYLIR